MIYAEQEYYNKLATIVAILAIMELGDLPFKDFSNSNSLLKVAILAIMELGDLPRYKARKYLVL